MLTSHHRLNPLLLVALASVSWPISNFTEGKRLRKRVVQDHRGVKDNTNDGGYHRDDVEYFIRNLQHFSMPDVDDDTPSFHPTERPTVASVSFCVDVAPQYRSFISLTYYYLQPCQSLPPINSTLEPSPRPTPFPVASTPLPSEAISTPAPSKEPVTDSPTQSISTTAPTGVCGLTNASRTEQIQSILRNVSLESDLDNPSSPQGRASQWIINEDILRVCPENERELVQRYVAAVFYFSVGGGSWGQCNAPDDLNDAAAVDKANADCKLSTNTFPDDASGSNAWLTASNECEWGGIACLPEKEDCPLCLDEISFGT
jgi:hypothetical protein|eukprot:scaffold2238_cov192-Alexandrium_tamarense.AAC.7